MCPHRCQERRFLLKFAMDRRRYGLRKGSTRHRVRL